MSSCAQGAMGGDRITAQAHTVQLRLRLDHSYTDQISGIDSRVQL
jgi:hypothetical protein